MWLPTISSEVNACKIILIPSISVFKGTTSLTCHRLSRNTLFLHTCTVEVHLLWSTVVLSASALWSFIYVENSLFFRPFVRYALLYAFVFFYSRIEGLEGWVSGWEGGVFVRQSEVTCVLHVNYEKHVPVVRLTTEEMDLVSQTVKSSFYPHFEK